MLGSKEKLMHCPVFVQTLVCFMVVHLEESQTWKGEFREHWLFFTLEGQAKGGRWMKSLESCPSTPDFCHHSSQNLEGSFPLPITLSDLESITLEGNTTSWECRRIKKALVKFLTFNMTGACWCSIEDVLVLEEEVTNGGRSSTCSWPHHRNSLGLGGL